MTNKNSFILLAVLLIGTYDIASIWMMLFGPFVLLPFPIAAIAMFVEIVVCITFIIYVASVAFNEADRLLYEEINR